ncbi:rod-binding protein [Microvirga makkahensis]|uniref:Flagellar protein FlgJ N-terminal domain-containing protein n=1 Tax=Microvirga makkahensis TaxID=1128670 RepID=A0A7X3MR53_9HYPH|nr:rod-binding protein [Microvirga makkahensis]MXQ11684.1 hypothetical protein [Microvirga makkahensis]
MAINPPSDIISDVARAADPSRYQAATRSLAQGSAPVGEATFEDTVRSISARPVGMGTDIYQIRNTLRNDAESAASDKSKKTAQDFEAFILQTFIESMLPKDAENSYGKGSAGSVWRSMLAEQVAAQVAKAGGIGIAKYISGEKT